MHGVLDRKNRLSIYAWQCLDASQHTLRLLVDVVVQLSRGRGFMVVVLPGLLRRLLLLETVLLLYQHRLALRLDHCYVATTCATSTRRFQLLLQLGLTAHVEVHLRL